MSHDKIYGAFRLNIGFAFKINACVHVVTAFDLSASRQDSCSGRLVVGIEVIQCLRIFSFKQPLFREKDLKKINQEKKADEH